MEHTRWFKDRVFYQIWPRSFKDGNGDGMGDLYGVYEKIEYIKSLGCDGIWFSPLYCSPGADCGYDISDYYHIDPAFGDLEIFKKVLDKAHSLDMKVIMDLVVNHTSDEHEWFEKSRRKIEPYTDYYIWRKGKNGKLPNNWDSLFEGKAWAYDEIRQEYYLHLFAIKQPDLNMDNPLVREEVKKILKYWLDMGVDGFREDVITLISKPKGLPSDHLLPFSKGILQYNHGPHIHEYLSEFKSDVFDNYDCMTLGESVLISPKKSLDYTSEAGSNELDMVIQFQCMCADCLFSDYIPTKFSLMKLKKAFSSWQKTLEGKAWNMFYLENHDHPRIISRYGSEKYRVESGKMLAAMYLFQKGTPFIYQGQEIGMINYPGKSLDDFTDVQTLNQAVNKPVDERIKLYNARSRENARTPLQWNGSSFGGFSTVEPWYHVNSNYTDINVENDLNNPDSILNFYKKAISLRKESYAVRNGIYKDYRYHNKNIYTYAMESEKESILVIASFTDKPMKINSLKNYDLSKGKLILSNYTVDQLDSSYVTKPYEVRVYQF